MKFVESIPAEVELFLIQRMLAEEKLFKRDHCRFEEGTQFGPRTSFLQLLAIRFPFGKTNDLMLIELQ